MVGWRLRFGFGSLHEAGVYCLKAGGGNMLQVLSVQISTRLRLLFKGIRWNDVFYLTGGVLRLLTEVHHERHPRLLLFFCL